MISQKPAFTAGTVAVLVLTVYITPGRYVVNDEYGNLNNDQSLLQTVMKFIFMITPARFVAVY
jgi:hypothetical protein